MCFSNWLEKVWTTSDLSTQSRGSRRKLLCRHYPTTLFQTGLRSTFSHIQSCSSCLFNILVADLGWVDSDYSVPPSMTACSAHSAKISSAQARFIQPVKRKLTKTAVSTLPNCTFSNWVGKHIQSHTGMCSCPHVPCRGPGLG